MAKEMVHSGYRNLSLKYHPDRGGSNEKQAALNIAFERLCRTLKF